MKDEAMEKRNVSNRSFTMHDLWLFSRSMNELGGVDCSKSVWNLHNL